MHERAQGDGGAAGGSSAAVMGGRRAALMPPDGMALKIPWPAHPAALFEPPRPAKRSACGPARCRPGCCSH